MLDICDVINVLNIFDKNKFLMVIIDRTEMRSEL